MANADIVVRGSTVVWTVTFVDVNGDPTQPVSAMLYLAYRRFRKPVEEQIAMAPIAGGSWRASWESAAADEGQLDWHIRSADTVTAAMQGAFRIDINKANPASMVTLGAGNLAAGSPVLL